MLGADPRHGIAVDEHCRGVRVGGTVDAAVAVQREARGGGQGGLDSWGSFQVVQRRSWLFGHGRVGDDAAVDQADGLPPRAGEL